MSSTNTVRGRSNLRPSGAELVAGLEDPPYDEQARDQERDRHAEAKPHVDVRVLVEAPAESAHEIDDGIEQADRLPDRRQHADRVERAAEEGERHDHEYRHDRELLPAIGPDTEDEAEQAEGDR